MVRMLNDELEREGSRVELDILAKAKKSRVYE
jgi:hypothetical protein